MNINELHQAAVKTSQAAAAAIARTKAETPAGGVAPKAIRQAEKEARRAHSRAMAAFLDAVDAIGPANISNLAELHSQIENIGA